MLTISRDSSKHDEDAHEARQAAAAHFIAAHVHPSMQIVTVGTEQYLTSRDAAKLIGELRNLGQSGAEYHLRKAAAAGQLASVRLHNRLPLYACADLLALLSGEER